MSRPTDIDPRGAYSRTFDNLPTTWKIEAGRRLCELLDKPGAIPAGVSRTAITSILWDIRDSTKKDRKGTPKG